MITVNVLVTLYFLLMNRQPSSLYGFWFCLVVEINCIMEIRSLRDEFSYFCWNILPRSEKFNSREKRALPQKQNKNVSWCFSANNNNSNNNNDNNNNNNVFSVEIKSAYNKFSIYNFICYVSN